MKYRQWKKNYKKRYGVNPPLKLDKRKQKKMEKKAMKMVRTIDYGAIAKEMAGLLIDAFATVRYGMDFFRMEREKRGRGTGIKIPENILPEIPERKRAEDYTEERKCKRRKG